MRAEHHVICAEHHVMCADTLCDVCRTLCDVCETPCDMYGYSKKKHISEKEMISEKLKTLGKGPKFKKRESMVFDHRGGRGVCQNQPDLKKDFKLKNLSSISHDLWRNGRLGLFS